MIKNIQAGKSKLQRLKAEKIVFILLASKELYLPLNSHK